MIKDALAKFLKNPLGYTKHVFIKTFIAPARYKTKDDYDAKQYWDDRFKKHGDTLVAVGDEGMDAEANRRMYEEAGTIFKDVIVSLQLDLPGIRTLEIGTGTGFFTGILHALGIRHFTGVDITDAFFEKLRSAHTPFQFLQKDITREAIDGHFDLIVMIDVIEHIVKEDKLAAALGTLQGSLNKGGYLLISPIMAHAKKQQFHFRWWDEATVAKLMPELLIRRRVSFRGNTLLVFQRPEIS